MSLSLPFSRDAKFPVPVLRYCVFLAATIVCLLFTAYPLAAQRGTGSIAGTVKDPGQAVLSGAKVTLSGASLPKPRVTATGHQGEFSFGQLAAGTYSVTVEAPGFAAYSLNKIAVDGVEVRQDVVLSLAGANTTVSVNGLTLDTDVKTQEQAVLIDLPEGIQGDSIVFTAKDIKALHPVSLVEILQTVPGMEMTFQGRQHLDFGSMRGGSFQIILDGEYLAQADRMLAMIPVQIVESMTIVRDSTALSIGPLLSYHTMGGSGSDVSNQGFIIIRTKRSARAEAGVVSSGGTYATALGHGYIGSKSGKWDYRGAYTYATSAGKDTWNMGYRNGSATFHGGYTSSGLTVDFLYYGTRGYRNFEYGQVLASSTGTSCTPTGVVGGLCATTMNMYKNDGDLYALNAVRHWNDSNRTVLQYGFANLHINSGMNAPRNILNEQDSTSANLLLKHTVLIKHHAVSAGGQLMRYIAPLGSAASSGYTYDRLDDAMASWFVLDDYHLLGNKLVLDGGVRSDKLHNGWSITAKSKADLWNPAFMTYSLGATYKFTPKLSSTARYGYLQYMPPTNAVMAATSTTNTSSLPNESQNRGEYSLTYGLSPHFKPIVTVYAYGTNNYPASATNCYNPVTKKTGSSSWTDPISGNEIDCVNPSAVLTGGSEFGLTGQLYGPLSYNAGYGYLATNNEATNLSMAHNFANAGLEYRKKNLFAHYTLAYVGPRVLTTISNVRYYGSDYTLNNLNGGYDFNLGSKPMTFTVFGRNLNDNNYATRYVTGAYRDPGRQWGVELAMKFF
ncbi:MAG: TonB-dependent receptor [Terracidiphilus sp.]|nr:TonB-dependent receptor [Terracidiphilus sp.]